MGRRAGGLRGARPPVWGSGGHPPGQRRRGHRKPPGLGAGRRRLRWPARRGVRLRRGRPAPGARVRPGPADRGGRVLGGGRRPVRRGLRGQPLADRGPGAAVRAGTARLRRDAPGRGDGRGRARPGAARAPTRSCWTASARSSSCTSSRAARWPGWAPRSGSRRASGRTAGGGSTSPAGPTTRAPPGWPTAVIRCCRTRPRCSPPGRPRPSMPRWPRSGRSTAEPGGANAICSAVRAWLDARAPDEATLHRMVEQIEAAAREAVAEAGRRGRDAPGVVHAARGVRPRAAGPAGRGAGAAAGSRRRSCRPAPAMTPGSWPPGCPRPCCSCATPPGCPHSPAEHADLADCEAGVTALAAVLEELAGP